MRPSPACSRVVIAALSLGLVALAPAVVGAAPAPSRTHSTASAKATVPMALDARALQYVAQGEAVTCLVRTILAKQKKGGIDKRLASLKQLKKPPFSAFKTLKLLGSKSLEIGKGALKQVALPSGHNLQLTLKERLLGRKNMVRLRMLVAITRPKAKGFLVRTVLSIANGGTTFVVGPKHEGGKLAAGITCRTK